ncbi:MAG: type II CAAX endopeptidase family protein [Bacillota bacterium]|nr:type II CAAX endopeptidase family protein [Bacillota bacterium]
MKGKLTVTGVNKVFFVFAVIFIAFSVLMAPLKSLFGIDLANHIYVVILINEFIIILVPCLIYIKRNKISFKETLKFKKLSPLAAFLIILAALPACYIGTALNNLVLYGLQFIGDIPAQPIPAPQNVTQLIIGILIIAGTPAICEELLNRGLILRAYERRGSIKAIAVTGLFFGFFHFDITNFLGPVFLGCLFSYYVLKTGSIFAGMLAHFLNNAIAELFSYLARNQQLPENHLTVTAADLRSILLLGVIGLIFLSVILIFFRFVRRGYQFKPSISRLKDDIVSIFSHWPIIVVVVLYILMFALTIAVMIYTKNSAVY